MKNWHKTIVLVTAILVFNRCHKYPQGGWTTNAVKHLTGSIFAFEKKWILTKYMVNGIDSTDVVNGKIKSPFTTSSIGFTRNFFEKTHSVCKTNRYTYNCILSDKRRHLSFESMMVQPCSGSSCEYDIFNPLKESNEIIVWKINKLTSKELSLIYLNQSIFELTLTAQE